MKPIKLAIAALVASAALLAAPRAARACSTDSPVACSDGQGSDWCCICACGSSTYACDDTNCQPACNSGLICAGQCCDYAFASCCNDGTCPGPDGCGSSSCPYTLCPDSSCPPAEGQCGGGNTCVTDCGDGTCCDDPSAPVCCPDGLSCGADYTQCANGAGSGRSDVGPGSSDSTGSSALPAEDHWTEDQPDCAVRSTRGVGTSSDRDETAVVLGAVAAIVFATRRRWARRRHRARSC